jgi:hypothetical protein
MEWSQKIKASGTVECRECTTIADESGELVGNGFRIKCVLDMEGPSVVHVGQKGIGVQRLLQPFLGLHRGRLEAALGQVGQADGCEQGMRMRVGFFEKFE